jgi:hypothetical protein
MTGKYNASARNSLQNPGDPLEYLAIDGSILYGNDAGKTSNDPLWVFKESTPGQEIKPEHRVRFDRQHPEILFPFGGFVHEVKIIVRNQPINEKLKIKI